MRCGRRAGARPQATAERLEKVLVHFRSELSERGGRAVGRPPLGHLEWGVTSHPACQLDHFLGPLPSQPRRSRSQGVH